MKKVLVLSPHTDDGELGCGATIDRLIKEKNEVMYVAFSYCNNYELVREMQKSMKVLNITNSLIFDYEVRNFDKSRQDILDKMIKIRNDFNPDMVFMPCSMDFHQDHEVICKEAIRAFHKTASLYGYILRWNILQITANCYYEVTADNMLQKFYAVQCYKSQKNRHYTNSDVIFAGAANTGQAFDVKYAEAFEVIKLIDKL